MPTISVRGQAEAHSDGNLATLTPLQEMIDQLRIAPAIYHPSPFWQDLAADHMRRLQLWGFDNFKRTISTRYFNWTLPGILAHQLLPILRFWLQQPDLSIFSCHFSDYGEPSGPGIASMGRLSAWLYKLYVCMLATWLWEQDPAGLFTSLEEPEVGNPWRIRFRDRWISQDLCNSIHEFYSAWDWAGWGQRPVSVAELGAGYGRLAHVFLEALPEASYCIIDIPPALYLAQEYLTRLFPHEAVFTFRSFQSYSEIREEFESARIRFLMAHQIEMLPPRQFDLVVTISSLHEMTRAQIQHYLSQIDRLARGRFYTKQWRKSRARRNRFLIREHEYPIPAAWQVLFHRHHPIQRWFFEALYQVGT